jgi:hypothetical protein
MSTADNHPRPVASSPCDSLLQYLAIGRLVVSPQTGELVPEKHRLVAHNFSKKDDPDPEWTKQVKSHVKAVMKRSAAQAGTRRRCGARSRSLLMFSSSPPLVCLLSAGPATS